jgi:hypothetical protein
MRFGLNMFNLSKKLFTVKCYPLKHLIYFEDNTRDILVACITCSKLKEQETKWVCEADDSAFCWVKIDNSRYTPKGCRHMQLESELVYLYLNLGN